MTTADAVRAFLQAHPEQYYSAQEIAQHTDQPLQTVYSTLANDACKGTVEKQFVIKKMQRYRWMRRDER